MSSRQEYFCLLIGSLTHWSSGAEILQERIQHHVGNMCASRYTKHGAWTCSAHRHCTFNFSLELSLSLSLSPSLCPYPAGLRKELRRGIPKKTQCAYTLLAASVVAFATVLPKQGRTVSVTRKPPTRLPFTRVTRIRSQKREAPSSSTKGIGLEGPPRYCRNLSVNDMYTLAPSTNIGMSNQSNPPTEADVSASTFARSSSDIRPRLATRAPSVWGSQVV